MFWFMIHTSDFSVIIFNTFSVLLGEFVLVHASYQTHLGTDCYFAPNSKLNDGIIWLMVIRAGITRAQLLQVCNFEVDIVGYSKLNLEYENNNVTTL